MSQLRDAPARLFQAAGTRHRVDVMVGNLFNKLYAEFPNAGFFRPESVRHASVGYTIEF